MFLLFLLAGCGEEFPPESRATGSSSPTAMAEPTPDPHVLEGEPILVSRAGETQEIALVLEPVATRLHAPLGIANAGDGSGRLFVLEKRGKVRIVQEGEVLPESFLDLSDVVSTRWERGLLGLAFEPGRPERFYVNYTNLEGNTVISRFRVGADPNMADRSSEEILLTIEQPKANHNGGNLVFGPDGYLWIGMGDGGSIDDPYDNGQNPYTLLGSMLRLDVSGETGYEVPPDNPYFYGDEGVPLVWAIGLRNPWRYSFDRETGELWLADVGQNEWEEVNRVPGDEPALNFGWPIMEGSHCFKAETCEREGLVMPVTSYLHEEDCSVTGGYVYRGKKLPTWRGLYFFGDFCSGTIRVIPAEVEEPVEPTVLLKSRLPITSFGEDEVGELYLTTYDGGLYRLVSR